MIDERGGLQAVHALVGPTASGKTEVSLRLAERTGAELVSMDSMLVYRGLDIGTAKPSAQERARVRHHLIDVAERSERYTLQSWLAEAERALVEIRERGQQALFVGGTALYLKALCYGLFEGPPTDLELRARIEARASSSGWEALHAELGRVDPLSAARIHRNDKKRVVRALETFEQTGRTLTDWQREWSQEATRPRRLVGLQVEPDELDRRIKQRTERMCSGGWIEEVRAFEAQAEALGPTAGQALGYAEILQLVRGTLGREACIDRIALRTRQFARRQRTWFKSFPDIVWIQAPRDAQDIERACNEALEALGWRPESLPGR